MGSSCQKSDLSKSKNILLKCPKPQTLEPILIAISEPDSISSINDCQSEGESDVLEITNKQIEARFCEIEKKEQTHFFQTEKRQIICQKSIDNKMDSFRLTQYRQNTGVSGRLSTNYRQNSGKFGELKGILRDPLKNSYHDHFLKKVSFTNDFEMDEAKLYLINVVEG